MIPFPYQVVGAEIMASRPRVYNADQYGLGKTLQALLALDKLGRPTTAILCPAIVRTHWRKLAEEVGVPLAYVESYDRYVRSAGAREAIQQLKPTVLVLDEAHRLSNMRAQRTQEVLLGLRHIPVIWPMSGTPGHNPALLFPLIAALWPQALRALDIRDYRSYLDTFCVWFEHPRWGVQVRGVRRTDLWKHLWGPLHFRRTAEEVLPQLPPMTIEELTLDATRNSEEVAALRDYESSGDVGALRDALDCYVLDPALVGSAQLRRLTGEAKAEFSAEVIAEELEGGQDKLFVVAYHRSVIDYLARVLQRWSPVIVHGDTPEQERETARLRFQLDPHCHLYIGQINTNAEGITLTAANVVHIVEPDWEPRVMQQVMHRILRIGQRRPCFARFHTLAGTLDESVMRVVMRKVRMGEQTGLGAALTFAGNERRAE
jgi:SWI/SNF-related matrix-associated actin-dependent regulator 1 of chromatin subfamily A